MKQRPATSRGIRVATVYRDRLTEFSPRDMSLLRWLKISEALARCGYEVDMMAGDASLSGLNSALPNLRFCSLSTADWRRYHVVKTLFHQGFETLCNAGGGDHSFIISKLGSVVGHCDETEGVHFFNQERAELFETQKKINERSRYITVLTRASLKLWKSEHGRTANMLLVPTGVDRDIPPAEANPYGAIQQKVAVYIGNLYEGCQREINLLWQRRLNALGKLLKGKGIRLFFVGPGATDYLDRSAVSTLGPVDGRRIWDFHYYADVGIVLGQGNLQHNESSKIYYYLRAGLPVVSETSVPNNNIIKEANLGFVAEYGDDRMMADMIEAAIFENWDRNGAVQYMLKHHTWDKRAKTYDRVIKRELKRD